MLHNDYMNETIFGFGETFDTGSASDDAPEEREPDEDPPTRRRRSPDDKEKSAPARDRPRRPARDEAPPEKSSKKKDEEKPAKADEASDESGSADEPKERSPRKANRADDSEEKDSKSDDDDDDAEDDDDEEEEPAAGGKDSWFSTGYKEASRITDREAAGGGNQTWRFFLKAGEEADLIFLDSGKADLERYNRKACAPFCIWEHSFATEDNEGNASFHNETCVAGKLGPDGKPRKCWICVNRPKIPRRYIGLYTIASKWESKRGVRWTKKLLAATKRLMKKIRRQEKRTGLFATLWNAFRTDGNSARVGDDWGFVKQFSEEKVLELVGEQGIEPLDYIEECRPHSWDELEASYAKAKISDPNKKSGKRRRRGGDDDGDRRRSDDDDDDRHPRRGRDDDDADGDDRPARRERGSDVDGDDDKRPARKPRGADDVPF